MYAATVRVVMSISKPFILLLCGLKLIIVHNRTLTLKVCRRPRQLRGSNYTEFLSLQAVREKVLKTEHDSRIIER